MTTKGAILKLIREFCLECCGGSTSEVNICTVGAKCQLYDFRMGKDPHPCSTKGFGRAAHVGFITNESLPIVDEVGNPTLCISY